jgi:hypothetical protein
MKRKLIVFVIFFSLGFMFVGPQHAKADTWAIASIKEVGQHLGNSIVILTHVSKSPVFTNKFFRLNSENKREMLVIALTAASMEKNIRILINNDGVTIDRIRLIAY